MPSTSACSPRRANANYPLLERLRFLSISGSNLDEFIQIRVAGLVGQVQRKIATVSLDGRITFAAARRSAHRDRRPRAPAAGGPGANCARCWPKPKIHVADEGRIDAEAARWLKDYFIENIAPVITPQAIDPAHPFPFVANEGIGVLFNLTRLADDEQVVEMVLVPSALPRFVRVPGEEALYICDRESDRAATPISCSPASGSKVMACSACCATAT